MCHSYCLQYHLDEKTNGNRLRLRLEFRKKNQSKQWVRVKRVKVKNGPEKGAYDLKATYLKMNPRQDQNRYVTKFDLLMRVICEYPNCNNH